MENQRPHDPDRDGLRPVDRQNMPTHDCMMVGSEIEQFLRCIVDHGTGVDTGGGFGQRDIWATVQGKEYIITIRPSEK